MGFNIQPVKRDVNGNFKSVRKFGNSEEESVTYTCSKCSETYGKDQYDAFLAHCFNHPKTNERTGKTIIHNSPVISKRNEPQTEQNADISSPKRNKIVDERPNSNRGLFENVKTFKCSFCPQGFFNEEAFLKHIKTHRRHEESTRTSDFRSNRNEIIPATIKQNEIQSSARQVIADRNNRGSQCFPKQMIIDRDDLAFQNHGLRERKDEAKSATIERTKGIVAQKNIIAQSSCERQNSQLNIDCNRMPQNLNSHKRDNEIVLSQNKGKKNNTTNEIKEDKRITEVGGRVEITSEYLNMKMSPMVPRILRAYDCDKCNESFSDGDLFVEHYKLHKAASTETQTSVIQQRNNVPFEDNMKQIEFIMAIMKTFFEYLSRNCNSETIPERRLEPASNNEFCEREVSVNQNFAEVSKLHEGNSETITGPKVTDVSDKYERMVEDTEQTQMPCSSNQNLTKRLDVDNSCKASELCTDKTALGVPSESGFSARHCSVDRNETETYGSIQDFREIAPTHEYNRQKNQIERDGNAAQNTYKRSKLEILAEASRMVSDIDEVSPEESNARSDNAHNEYNTNVSSNNSEEALSESDEELQIVFERRVIQRKVYHVTERKLVGEYDQCMVTVSERILALPNSRIDCNGHGLSERPMRRIYNHRMENSQHSMNVASSKNHTYSNREIREMDIPSTSMNSSSIVHEVEGNASFNSGCADSDGIGRRVSVKRNESDCNVNEINFPQSRINGINPISRCSKENGGESFKSAPTTSSLRISDNLKVGNSSTNQPLKTYSNHRKLKNSGEPLHQTSRNNTGFEQQNQPNETQSLSESAYRIATNSRDVSKNQEQCILNHTNRRDINPEHISQLNCGFIGSNVLHKSTNNASLRNSSENSAQNTISNRNTFRNRTVNNSRRKSLPNKFMYDHESKIRSPSRPLPVDKKIGSDLYDIDKSDKNHETISDNVSDGPDTGDDIKILSDDGSDNDMDTGSRSEAHSRKSLHPFYNVIFSRENCLNHTTMPESRTEAKSNDRNKNNHTTKKPKAIECEKCDLIFEDHAEFVDHFLKHKSEKESQNTPSETEMCQSLQKKHTTYKCSTCGKVYKYKSSLDEHSKSHQSNYRKCKVCRKGFVSESSIDDAIKDICKDCETFLRMYAGKLNNPSITTNKEKCSKKDKDNSRHGNELRSDRESSNSNNTMECAVNEKNKRKERSSTESQSTECFRREGNQNRKEFESRRAESVQENSKNSKRHKRKQTLECRKVGNSIVEKSKGGSRECCQVNVPEMRKKPASYVNALKNRVCSKKTKNHKQKGDARDRNEIIRSNGNLPRTDVEHKGRDTPFEADDEMESPHSDLTTEETEVNNRACESELEKSPKPRSNGNDTSKKGEGGEKSGKIVMQLQRCENNEYRLKTSSVSSYQLTCKYCRAPFRSTWAYIKHIRQHTGSEYFHCNICNHRIESRVSLQTHFRLYHPDEKIQ